MLRTAREELLRAAVLRLHALLRLAEDPSTSPPVLHAVATQALAALQPLLTIDGCLLLQGRAGALFANGRRIQPDVGALAAIEAIGRSFARARIAGFVCEAGVEVAALAAFAVALRDGPVEPELALERIGVLADWDATADGAGGRTRDTRLQSVQVVRQLLPALDDRGRLDLGLQRRIVHRLVDALLARPEALALLDALDAGDVPRLRTAVRTAVHAVALAEELALDAAGQACVGLRVLLGPDEAHLPPGLLPVPVLFEDLLAVAERAADGADAAHAAADAPPALQAAARRAFR